MNFVLLIEATTPVLATVRNNVLKQYNLIDLSESDIPLSDVLVSVLTQGPVRQFHYPLLHNHLVSVLTQVPDADEEDLFNIHVLTVNDEGDPTVKVYAGVNFPSLMFNIIHVYGYITRLHLNNLIHQCCTVDGDVDIRECLVPDDLVTVSIQRGENLVLWVGPHSDEFYSTLIDAEVHNFDFCPMLSIAVSTVTALEPKHPTCNMTQIMISVADGDITVSCIQLHPDINNGVQCLKIDKLVRAVNQMTGPVIHKMDAIRQMTIQ